MGRDEMIEYGLSPKFLDFDVVAFFGDASEFGLGFSPSCFFGAPVGFVD